MLRDDALALIEIARSGTVPEIDIRRLSEWFVALNDRNGMRKGLKLLDQQMRRTDKAVARVFAETGQARLRLSHDPA